MSGSAEMDSVLKCFQHVACSGNFCFKLGFILLCFDESRRPDVKANCLCHVGRRLVKFKVRMFLLAGVSSAAPRLGILAIGHHGLRRFSVRYSW